MKISFKRESKCSLDFTCEPLSFSKQVVSAIWNAFTGMLKYIFPWLSS